jgi:hypothetical protein
MERQGFHGLKRNGSGFREYNEFCVTRVVCGFFCCPQITQKNTD